MKIQNLSALILCATSMQVAADKEYWVGTDGEYVHDRNGHCVRTIKWTAEAAIPGCEGAEAKAAAKEKAPVATKAEPVKSTPATEAVGMAVVSDTQDEESEYVTLSLASSATFELGGSTLSAEGKAAVADLVGQFKGREVNSVIIEGHTDGSGDAAFNQDLSEKRAEAVKAEIVANMEKPENADKITTVGYGESKPIADNGTSEGRAKNRRVEIKIDEKK
jgi:OOP family OmpA-OmpF porin